MEAILLDAIGTILKKKSPINFLEVSAYLQKAGYNIHHQSLHAAYRYIIFVKFGQVPIHSYEELSKLIFKSMSIKVDENTLNVVARIMKKGFQLELYDDVMPFLKKVKGKYKLALVTTTPRFMFEEFLGETIDFYDEIITGLEVKTSKPDPKVYLVALNKLNVKPNQAVYIGDEVELDIIPPKKLGMKTIFINREGVTCSEADHSVKSLNEALEYIHR